MKIFRSFGVLALTILLCQISIDCAILNEKTSCSYDQTEIFQVEATKTVPSNKWCLATSSVVFDCIMYKSDGTCKACPTGSKLTNYYKENIQPQIACIPLLQTLINCIVYNRIGANNYQCIACQPSMAFKSVSITGNADGITKACIPSQIPGCQTYKQFGSNIGCETCLAGYSSFTGTFYYQSSTLIGKACPKDGIITGCSTLTLVSGQYVCKSDGCTAADTVPINFREGSVFVSCISKTSAFLIANCLVYNKYDADPSKIECVQCMYPYQFSKNVLVAKDTYRSACVFSGYFSQGCLEKVVATTDGTVLCKKCDSLHVFVPLSKISTAKLNYIDPSIQLGQCILPDQYIIDRTKCAEYEVLIPYYNTAWCLKCVDSGRLSPCDDPKGTCVNGQREINLLVKGVQTKTCLDSSNSRITTDHCALYESLNFNGCLKCEQRYELVTTLSLLYPIIERSCIKKTYVRPGCLIYEFTQLTCLQCRPGQNCGLSVQPYKPSVCIKNILVGVTNVCIACKVGYTLKNNTCLKSVQHCANLVSDGYCLACIKPQKYQLISNFKCVERPLHCISANMAGTCDVCENGYDLDQNKTCVLSTKNPCSIGMYLSVQGECVIGKIKDCLKYTKNGDMCVECKPTFILQQNFKRCTSTEKWADLPPCPQNTNKIRHERNYLGKCIAIDVNCQDYNQDGYCYACKDGGYAFQGLCYKVQIQNQEK